MAKKNYKYDYGFKISCRKHLIVLIVCVPLLFLRLISLIRNLIFRYENSKTVVIVEPFGMGDVIMHEPLVRILQESGYSVIFCGRPVWKSTILESESIRWQDISVPWSAVSFAEKYRIFGNFIPSLSKTVRGLAKIGNGTIGIDTRGDVRSIFLLHLAGCRKVYSLSHYLGSSMHIPHCGVERVWQEPSKVRWRLNLDFASALGIDVKLSDIAPPNVDHLLHNGIKSMSTEIALIPFAAGEGKRWPIEHWQEFITMVKDHGLYPRWFCGPGQRSEIVSNFGETIACTEIHSIEEWINELTKCKAVISVNTGPMHIAAALDLPLIVMDGSSTLPLWSPQGKNSMVIHHQDLLPCAPCHQVGGRHGCDNECMRMVNPAEVIQSLLSVVGKADS